MKEYRILVAQIGRKMNTFSSKIDQTPTFFAKQDGQGKGNSK
ncbi:hypothetical protein [Mariniphaga anaerophila]|nr:hypothetical protein [Mariniphaga anaerophila]